MRINCYRFYKIEELKREISQQNPSQIHDFKEDGGFLITFLKKDCDSLGFIISRKRSPEEYEIIQDFLFPKTPVEIFSYLLKFHFIHLKEISVTRLFKRIKKEEYTFYQKNGWIMKEYIGENQMMIYKIIK